MASARDTLAQPQRDAQPQGGLWDVRHGHPVVRDPQVLHPHPLYTALCGPIAAIRAQRVAADDGPIREPLTITADGTILDGHARWQVACQRRDSSLPCLVYDLTTEDALQLARAAAPECTGPQRLRPHRARLAVGAAFSRPTGRSCRRSTAAVNVDEGVARRRAG